MNDKLITEIAKVTMEQFAEEAIHYMNPKNVSIVLKSHKMFVETKILPIILSNKIEQEGNQ